MIRFGLVSLSLLFSAALFADQWQERKIEALSRRPAARVAPNADKPITVDCTKDSLQQKIDQNPSGVVIDVRGVCIENVRIFQKDVTLRGLSAATDGLRSPNTTPALVIDDAHLVVLENLSFNNSPGAAMQMLHSRVQMTNCTASGNNTSFPVGGASAIQVANDSFLDATNLTMSGNQRRGVTAVNGARFFCHACDFSGNLLAAAASTGSVLSLLNSTVTGRFGIQAIANSYADIDCISEVSAHPCSMQATGVAAQGFDNGNAVLFGAGDFTGQVHADDRGVVQLYGARQLATGQPGQGPPVNVAGLFGIIYAIAAFEVDPPLQSRLMATDVHHFGRVLVAAEATLAGNIQCRSAGDAQVDETVIISPGVTVTGCDHASVP